MTKKRNGIADYRNSAIFWSHVVKIRRGKDTYLFEENRASDLDLLILCLALAMDNNFYDLLISKRSELPEQLTERDFRLPNVGDDEKNILRERLLYAGEHFRAATEHANFSDEYSVPRRILFDVNLYLLRSGKSPIIHLIDDEIIEVTKYVPEKVLEGFYHKGTLSEGNKTFSALRLNLPIK